MTYTVTARLYQSYQTGEPVSRRNRFDLGTFATREQAEAFVARFLEVNDLIDNETIDIVEA